MRGSSLLHIYIVCWNMICGRTKCMTHIWVYSRSTMGNNVRNDGFFFVQSLLNVDVSVTHIHIYMFEVRRNEWEKKYHAAHHHSLLNAVSEYLVLVHQRDWQNCTNSWRIPFVAITIMDCLFVNSQMKKKRNSNVRVFFKFLSLFINTIIWKRASCIFIRSVLPVRRR